MAKAYVESRSQTSPLEGIEEQTAAIHTEAQTQTKSLQELGGLATAQNVWLEKTYTEARTQRAAIQSIGKDVAGAIYKGLDECMNEAADKFCTKLEEKILPQVDRICTTIDKLRSDASKAIGDIFTGKVGSQMDRFSAVLDNFSDSIDAKLKSAEKISELMNEQLLKTLSDLNDALIKHAETDDDERNVAFEQAANKDLIKTAEPVKQSTQQLTRNLNETAEQLRSLSIVNQTTRQNLFDLSTRLNNFVKNFNGIANELKRSTAVIAGKRECRAIFYRRLGDPRFGDNRFKWKGVSPKSVEIFSR